MSLSLTKIALTLSYCSSRSVKAFLNGKFWTASRSPSNQVRACAAGATLRATMKLVATIAALGLAGVSTSACGQECKGPVNIPIDDPVSAQTAKCLLSVDSRLLVNERCQVLFLPDGSEVVSGFRPLLTAAVYPSFSPAGIAEAVAMIGSRRLVSSKLLNERP